MKQRKYVIYDVFSDKPLAGNPLAVVLEAEGLDTDAMQRIAREFNLSETVFVLPAVRQAHTAAIRIFMPNAELPFAGHPTVGTAVALAEAGKANTGDTGALLVLEEKIGDVRCAVLTGRGAPFAEFDLPKLPQPLDLTAEAGSIAAALGLGPHEIGFENHVPSLWSAGVPYVCVPVAGLDVAGRVRVDPSLWLECAPRVNRAVCAPYLYCRDTVGHDNAFHARMFAPWDGIAEDPATGSAAAALAGAIVHFDSPKPGSHRCWIEQGIEMGRPSRIRLEIDVEDRVMTGARIGGHAVKVAEGMLHL